MATDNPTRTEGYLFYPGCALKGTGRAYEASMRALFRLLELPLKELTDWNCCGATTYMATDSGTAFRLASRNLSLTRQSGGTELLAPCNGCYLTLKKAMEFVEHYSEVREDVQQYLESVHLPTLDEPVKVRHPLEVLYNDVGLERLRQASVRKWTYGPVACYYGCQAVRPYAEVDRDANPMRMDELLQAVGVPTAPFALKTKCCGASHTGTLREIGIRLSYILLREAVRQGAQAIVTMCPLCQFNLDVFQNDMRRQDPKLPVVPVLYFTQVLAWALGAEPSDLAIEHCLSGTSKVREWFTSEKGVAARV